MTATIVVVIVLLVLIIYLTTKSKMQIVEVGEQANNNEQETTQLVEVVAGLEKINGTASGHNTEKTLFTSANKSYNSEVIGNSDNSLIDVTDQQYELPIPSSQFTGVPYWSHQYVYGYEVIDSATSAQRAFYELFKSNFLQGVYLDVQGNSNYYFVLLFDLLQESDKQSNLDQLKTKLEALAKHYPRTAGYCKNFLIKKLQERGEYGAIEEVTRDDDFQGYAGDSTHYRLGSRYKQQLGLNEKEVELLNRLWYSANNFSDIEFCLLQLLRLFLRTTDELNKAFLREGTSLQKEIATIADTVARKMFHYKSGSSNYHYSLESTSKELYVLVLKHCENALRELYCHKRKLSPECNYRAEIKNIVETRLISKLPAIHSSLLSEIEMPDARAEVSLNEQNTTRWKKSFEKLTEEFSPGDGSKFLRQVIELGKLNARNPSVENIFYEASKFIAKWDREVALNLYIHYLDHDIRSPSLDQKPFTKTLQKSLFRNADELHLFQAIVTDLIKHRDLQKALASITDVYAPKRKKIKLDSSLISEVHKQHNCTVGLLDEILNDDWDEARSAVHTSPNTSELEPDITGVEKDTMVAALPGGLTAVQYELLDLFRKNSFVVTQQDVESFAHNRNMFGNALIEGLNECYYEKLDDVLVEEEDDNYIMNEDYYQKLMAND